MLELGSGAGLTGLAICKGCRPGTYVFSDGHSRVLELLRHNIRLNGLSPQPDVAGPGPRGTQPPWVTVARLDWDVVTGPELAAFQPDVIIAAGVGQGGRGTRWAPRWHQSLTAAPRAAPRSPVPHPGPRAP